MRRYHRPAFLELSPTPDNISLLLGAEADRERWRSSVLPSSPREQEKWRNLDAPPQDASGANARVENGVAVEHGEDVEPSPGFLGRVNSYSRIMHAHTKSQLLSPTTGTVPAYRRTMHAFTLNQLSYYQRVSKSAASSPYTVTKHVQLPTRLDQQQVTPTREEPPPAPSNTPDCRPAYSWPSQRMSEVHGIDFRKLKRSVTEPHGRSCLLAKGSDIVVV